MAQFQENFKIAAPNPIDKRYLSLRTSSGAQVPYSATTEVYSTIIPSERYKGLTVLIESGSTNVEYWFKDDINNGDLIEKKYDSIISSGDFITGATNIGYFSGTTSIQKLEIATTIGMGSNYLDYDGDYYSLYNNYYRGTDGAIHIGTPPSDGINRRGYVKNDTPIKSWVWNESGGLNTDPQGWIFLNGDVSSLVSGGFVTATTYGTPIHTETGYTHGQNYSLGADANINNTVGNLGTGTTLTIGGRTFAYKDDNKLHFRTIISETPDNIKIWDDNDALIRVSGVTSVLNGQNHGGGVGIYSGTSNGQMDFRTLIPSGDTVITQRSDGGVVIFSSSADGSGNAITGATNTGGGVGISSGVANRNLQLNSLVGSGDTSVSKVGDDVIIYSSGGTGGVNGSVFITNITPQSTGNVGGKVFSSDGVVLDDCVVDTQLVTVSVLGLPGDTNYKPVLTINGAPVSITAQPDKPLFSGSINIDLSGATELTVIHEDGAQHTVNITQDTPPQVLVANFTGGYPNSQTELKENDVFDFYVESDVPIINVQLDNFEAYKSGTFPVASGTGHTITGIIADRGVTAQNQRGRVRVQKSTGGWSSWFTTTVGVDGVGHVVLNNLHPEITFGVIDYPASQSALKDTETAIVNHTVDYQDTTIYSNPTGQLAISSPNNYELAKSVSRVSGGYNITTNNFTITANRIANDATTIDSIVVWIADATQIISVSTPYNRLRSGGNDGTTAQDYPITISSTQRLAFAPTLVAPVGTWLGGGFTWSANVTSFTRSLRIHDVMNKGTYSWGVLSTTNLAGRVVSTITNGSQYVLGGFVSRNIPLTAFLDEATMHVAVVDYSKVVLNWSYEPTVTNRYPLDTPSSPPITDGWCLVSPITNPTIIRILDAKTNASSQESIITIQEGI